MSEDIKSATYTAAVRALIAGFERNAHFFLCVIDVKSIDERESDKLVTAKAHTVYNLPQDAAMLETFAQIVQKQYEKSVAQIDAALQIQAIANRERN